MTNTQLVPLQIEDKIITIRNQNVILDFDVAKHYGVQTREVSQAIKRNPKKFPNEEYIFRLSVSELKEVKALAESSQLADIQQPVTNCDRLLNIKHITEINALTEKGLYMLATILKSERAIDATRPDEIKARNRR